MESLAAYIPMDRRQAMAQGKDLPDRARGAALSADISGFTPLTEALVRKLGPKRGAEELTKQLNLVYTALIVEVHRFGGSVIAFGGDAINCWFDRDDGRRATACALAMQAAMSQFSRVEIPPNITISLAMRAAVVSGPVRRFLVGDPAIQIIDVLAGATLDHLAMLEKQARPGEVIAGGDTLGQVDSLVKTLEWRADANTGREHAVVSELASPVETASWPTRLPDLSEEQTRSWILPPVYEKLKAGQGEFLAEIRPAAALFLKFIGLDYDQDDTAGRKLDAFIRWVQNVLVRYEGCLLQLTTGDKDTYLYAVFGAPLAHDDDAARAVAAAIELQSPPPELSFISEVQIGISQGRMRTGAYGSPARRTYGVLGDEVNVAARLMANAEPGQILISKRVADAVSRDYHLLDLQSIRVKGKRDPMPVSVVLNRQRSSPRSPSAQFETPLVGRDDELARIEQVVKSVAAGEGRILRLEGMAGIGKSRLAAELVERAQGRNFCVAVGACQSTNQDIIYHPWRQAFRSLFGLEFSEGSEWADSTGQEVAQVKAIVEHTNRDWLIRLPLLGDLLGLPIPDNETTAALDRKLRQEALFALVVEMVQAWARSQPLLLLIEDAHWLDEASRGLMLAVGRTATRLPLLLAVVHRLQAHDDKPLLPELDRLPSYHLLNLRELAPAGAEALVTNYLSGSISPLALSLIQSLAQGNPFFTEELVNTLRETGKLDKKDGTWMLSEAMFSALLRANCLERDATVGQWILAGDAPLSAVALDLPDTTQAAVLARLDRLPEMHKTTLKVASVIGQVFEFDLLVRSHPLQPGPAALLGQLEMLGEDDRLFLEASRPRLTYRFKHHIIREVAYDTLLEEQQRELHRAVGEALESLQPGAVERLAYHYVRSGVRDKALIYLDRAAHKAQGEYANETALSYYNQALALEERWGWLKGRAEVLHILGRRDDEQASLTALETAPGARDFDVAYLWAQYYEAEGDYDQAQANIGRAMAACPESGDVADRGRCLIQLGLIARRQGSYPQAKELYGQALELLPDTCPDEKSQAMSGLGTVCRQLGSFEEARAHYERAFALSSESGNQIGKAQALDNLGTVFYHQRDLAKAVAHHQQALEIRRTIGDRAGEGASLGNLSLATRDAGDYTQALAYLSEALNIHQATGNRWEEVNDWSDLGVLLYFLGDLPTAQTHLQQGLELSRELGDKAGETYVLGNLGLVVRDREDLAAAEAILTEGLALARAPEQADQYAVSYFLSHLGIVHLRAGRLDQATNRAHEALALRQELDLRLWTTADLTTLAAAYLDAGNVDEALNCARQALTILDECGGEGPEFPHRDYFVCYQVLSAAGENEAANAALESAYNLVATQADKITDPALRQSFLEQVQINRTIMSERKRRETQCD